MGFCKTKLSASVPLTRILVTSKTFLFLDLVFWQTPSCFSMRSAAKFRPQKPQLTNPSAAGPVEKMDRLVVLTFDPVFVLLPLPLPLPLPPRLPLPPFLDPLIAGVSDPLSDPLPVALPEVVLVGAATGAGLVAMGTGFRAIFGLGGVAGAVGGASS